MTAAERRRRRRAGLGDVPEIGRDWVQPVVCESCGYRFLHVERVFGGVDERHGIPETLRCSECGGQLVAA